MLGSWCQPGDIVTPVGVEDEITRRAYGGEPRNFCDDRNLEWRYRQARKTATADELAPTYQDVMRRLAFHHHQSASEARSMLPADFWNRAIKIAVDRHPYEKAVSLAYWRGRRRQFDGSTWTDWLDRTIDGSEYRNYDLYADGDGVLVDRVIPFASLWDGVRQLATEVGATVPDDLPAAKAAHRRDRRPAAEILTPDQRRRVEYICADEFHLLGWPTA